MLTVAKLRHILRKAKRRVKIPAFEVFLNKSFTVEGSVWQINRVLVRSHSVCAFECTAHEIESRVVIFVAQHLLLLLFLYQLLLTCFNTAFGDWVILGAFNRNLLIESSSSSNSWFHTIDLGALARLIESLIVVVHRTFSHGRVLDCPDWLEH